MASKTKISNEKSSNTTQHPDPITKRRLIWIFYLIVIHIVILAGIDWAIFGQGKVTTDQAEKIALAEAYTSCQASYDFTACKGIEIKRISYHYMGQNGEPVNGHYFRATSVHGFQTDIALDAKGKLLKPTPSFID